MTDMHRGQWDAYARGAAERLRKPKNLLGLVLALLLATASAVFSQVIVDYWRQLTGTRVEVPVDPNGQGVGKELDEIRKMADGERNEPIPSNDSDFGN